MTNSQFDVQFARVGQFIKRNSPRFRTAEVRIFSEFIRVNYKTSDVVRSLPKGSDEVTLFADSGFVIIQCYFYFKDEKVE